MATKELFANAAKAKLAAGINATDVALTVTTGKGVLFRVPVAANGELARLVVKDVTTGNFEIMTYNGRTSDTLSGLVRGLEGTTPQNWAAGVLVEMRITRSTMEGLSQLAADETVSGKKTFTDMMRRNADSIDQGSVNYALLAGTDAYTGSIGISSYVEGAEYKAYIANQNQTTTPTINFDSIGAMPVKEQDGTSVEIGALNGNHTFRVAGTDLHVLNPKRFIVKNRNESFEDGLYNWSQNAYAGGTISIMSVGAVHGTKRLSIASTVLANGGGYVTMFVAKPVIAGGAVGFTYSAYASAADISHKAEALWYDNAGALLSTSLLFQTPNTSASSANRNTYIHAVPTGATSVAVRLTGGIPNVGTATGSVYFDGVEIDTNISKYKDTNSYDTYTKQPTGLMVFGSQLAQNANNYLGPVGMAATTTEGNTQRYVPACYAYEMHINLASAVPVGQSCDVKFRVAGANTTLVATMAAGEQKKVIKLTTPVTIPAVSLVSVLCTTSATFGTTNHANVTIVARASTTHRRGACVGFTPGSAALANQVGYPRTGGGTNYYPAFATRAASFDSIYRSGSTLRLNVDGAYPALPKAVTDLQKCYFNTVGTNDNGYYLASDAANSSIAYTPILFSSIQQAQATTIYMGGLVEAGDGVEENHSVALPEGRLGELRVISSAALPAGQSATFTVRINGAATALTATIAAGQQTAKFDTSELYVKDGDVMAIECTSSATAGTLDYGAAVEHFIWN